MKKNFLARFLSKTVREPGCVRFAWIKHVSKLQKRQLEHPLGHVIWFRCQDVQSFKHSDVHEVDCIKMTHSERVEM